MSEWKTTPLAEMAEITMGQSPESHTVSEGENGLPFLQGCAEFGARNPIAHLRCNPPLRVGRQGSVLISVRAPVGTTNYADQDYCIGRGLGAIEQRTGKSDSKFLLYAIEENVGYLHRRSQGSTFAAIGSKELSSLPVPDLALNHQRRIATILTSLDEEIEATEALIAKHQQIKAGLMHDLFTRGLWTQAELARGDHKGLPCEATAKEGQLRPTPEEAPGLYQETEIGLIPKAWRCEEVASLLANTAVPMRSGPFGSALLKDELVENGIPLLGIDNVFVERFEPTFRRFVSPWKFLELSRYEAFAGDVVITIMGTVGRCCVIPDDIGQTLSSKHLWTMTFDPEQILPDLVCWQLNHAAWVKNWFLRHAQGAVMDAIQSSTLRTLRLPVPPITEQHQILARYRSISNSIETDLTHLAKLRQQKQGLMHDLLTGRVRVDGLAQPEE